MVIPFRGSIDWVGEGILPIGDWRQQIEPCASAERLFQAPSGSWRHNYGESKRHLGRTDRPTRAAVACARTPVVLGVVALLAFASVE